MENNYSTNIITETDKKIVDLQKEIKLNKLNENEFKIVCIGLLYKISAITGWQLPEKNLLAILVDQFNLKLKESYLFLSEKEIEYAFRNTSVKEYGKNFNLLLFCEVVDEYREKRKEVLKSNQSKPMELPAPQETDEDKIKFIESYCNRDEINLKNLYLIPAILYDDIIKLKLYQQSKEKRDKIYEDAKKFKLKEYEERAKNDLTFNKYYQKYKDNFEKGYFEESEWNSIDSIFMKLSFLDYKNNVRNAKSN